MVRHLLRALAGLLLLVPSAAWAANPAWIKVPGGSDCGALNANSVCSFQWTSAADANSAFLATGGRPFSLRIEPDKSGAGTAAQAKVYACTSTDGNNDGTQDTTACTELQWDTDGDGIVDNSTLDATSPMKVGTPVFMGIPWIYVDPIADPAASHTAEVTAVGEQE